MAIVRSRILLLLSLILLSSYGYCANPKVYDLSFLESSFWKKKEKLLVKNYLASDYLLRKKEDEIQKDARYFLKAFLAYVRLEERRERKIKGYALEQLRDIPLALYLKAKADEISKKQKKD